jgi:hypothetical protein
MASRVNGAAPKVESVTDRGRGPGLHTRQLTRRPGTARFPAAATSSIPRLMCPRYWYLVPKQLRDWVWATWRSGEGAFSHEHHNAVPIATATAAADAGPVR